MSEPKSNWKNWGDHPIVVFITLVSAIIGIVTFFTVKKDESPNPVNKSSLTPVSTPEMSETKPTLVPSIESTLKPTRSPTVSREDSLLNIKIQLALEKADDLRGTSIEVDVTNGVVTLSGTVSKPEQKIKAVEIVKGIEGIKSIKDTLRVDF